MDIVGDFWGFTRHAGLGAAWYGVVFFKEKIFDSHFQHIDELSFVASIIFESIFRVCTRGVGCYFKEVVSGLLQGCIEVGIKKRWVEVGVSDHLYPSINANTYTHHTYCN